MAARLQSSRLPLGIVMLILVPLLLYLRVATFGYAHADDTDLVRDNQAFLRNPGNLPEAFTRSYFEAAGQRFDRKTYYRPLVVVSLMIDAQVSGPEPGAYHVTNVFIHVVAVLLLFSFLRTLGTGELPALLLALVFAVHPAHAQTVCWIPGRNDSLMAVFALVSLIGLATWLRTSTGRSLLLHLAGFAAALFTKESAIVLLPLSVLFAALQSQPLRHFFRSRVVLGSYVVVLLGWYALRRAALAGTGEGLSAREYVTTVVANAPDLLLYVGKIALPLNLNVMPGLTPMDATFGVVSLGLLAWLFVRYLERRMRLFVIAWFLLFVAPALLVPGLPAYEHRLYLPLAGVIVGASQLRIWSASDRRRAGWIAGIVAIQVLFAALAFAHTGVFRDRYSYWSNATQGTPYVGVARVNLGQLYEADDDVARAAEQYRQALADDPTTPGANNNLGVLAARSGELDRAVAHFEAEVALYPANADAHYNLGLAHTLAGRRDDAVAPWERAIVADPYYLPAYRALATYYREKGDTARAQYFLDRVTALEAR